ncbi:hypothetical protein OO013_04230 [Mangrovivirga sp. M17]|uniref:Glycosyl-4,4'-diaponeurosporenoate acyltransferase n=1 Tax=Mangrovivirga halotolerans TaxID=2993936 RepID=A0ABT3RML9_9BACT|nr:hypothetical protein [Mangrovivirga halotolerans]MCX2743057.1 hypothetical protein [Mangrovivirga halotolerans]
MEKIKYTLFDFFGFVLPGSFLIFSATIILNKDVESIKDLIKPFNDVSLSVFTIGMIAAYLVGNGIHNLGYWVHTKVGLKYWQVPKSYLKPKLAPAKMDALIREFSPRNADTLDLWNALRAMSHNLSLGFLFFGFTGTIKLIEHSNLWLEWTVTSTIAFIFSIQCLKRAFFYHVWYYRDRKAIYEALKLSEKVNS